MQEGWLLLIDDIGDDFEGGIGMAPWEASAILRTIFGILVDNILLL